jgi:DNA polymerase-3 subunit gamma/tau
MDVHELDAASNNGVDAMRDLVAHSALGTPGRWKVYIVDEVHMLSTAASNALLKTLEEPPGHVVFVLATTDAQKVLPTIRSRTQHFEFRLLGPEVLAGLLRRVRDEAGLDLADDAVDGAVRKGRGSARDALSALDQVAAGGTFGDEIVVLGEIVDALAERDPSGALVGVAKACDAGHDPQRLAGELADYLRQGFLAILAPELVSMAGDERSHVEDRARRMGLPAVVRAMEALGRAIVDMRDTPDPRVHLEAALIRLAHPDADDSTTALLERIERLERALESGEAVWSPTPRHTTELPGSAPVSPRPTKLQSPSSTGPSSPGPGSTGGAERPAERGVDPDTEGTANGEAETTGPSGVTGSALARRALGALLGKGDVGGSREANVTVPGPSPGPERTPATGALPSRDELVQVWGDCLLASLPGRARARFRVGRFVATENDAAVFALPNETHRSYCEEVRVEVESALRSHFGTVVPLRLVVDQDSTEETPWRVPRRSRGDLVSSRDKGVGGGAPKATSVPSGAALTRTSVGTSRRVGLSDDDRDAVDDPDVELLDASELEAQTEPAGTQLSLEEQIKLVFPGAEEV